MRADALEWLSGKEAAIVVAVLFLGFLLYSRAKRRQDEAWIAKRFPGQKPVVCSFGVTYWGRESDSGPLRKRRGFLLLLRDRLVFKGPGDIEWELSGQSVTGVDHDTAIRGMDLNQSVMIVQFENADGMADRAAFRVPYPPQWMKAIEVTLINRPAAGRA